MLLRAVELGKAYPRDSDPRGRLRAFGGLIAGRGIARVPVLEGVTLEVRRGESLGIVGENGSGKSTLLKLLAGVLTPTTGTLERHGSLGALLELGAGFDRERSGRANIPVAAGLMGWSAAQIAARFDEIVTFADLGRYLDEPVKHYSSGMVVRLGFAIVAAVRPDLLITDEVLAVGDESFQKKCIRWMEDYLAGGGTLLLVSHSMYHVQKLCKHALWLRAGRVHAQGDATRVTQDYLAYHEHKASLQRAPELDRDYGGSEYRITAVSLGGDGEASRIAIEPGEGFAFEAQVYAPDGREPQLAFGLLRADGTPVYGSTSEIGRCTPAPLDATHWCFRVRLDALPLLPGEYVLKLHAMDPEGLRLFDTVERGVAVRGHTREQGLVRLPHRWRA